MSREGGQKSNSWGCQGHWESTKQKKGNLNLTVFLFMSSKVSNWLEVCKVVTLRSVVKVMLQIACVLGGRGTLYVTCIQTDVNLMMFVVSRCVSKSSYLA